MLFRSQYNMAGAFAGTDAFMWDYAAYQLSLGTQTTYQGSLKFNNLSAGAGYSVVMKSSNLTTAGWTLTLPINAGANGQVLITDGLGVSAWSNLGGLPTGFTAGSATFVGATGLLAQDNANFFWDDSNNRLGIGTSTPAVSLQVVGGQIRLDNDQSIQWEIGRAHV